jgi:hypothetical protein
MTIKTTIAVAIAFAIAVAVWFAISPRIPAEPIDQMAERVESDLEGRSSAWPIVRAAHVANFPTCAACGSTEALNVHHIEPFHAEPELELEPTNLITLCRRHHFEIGHDPDGPWQPGRPSWNRSNPRVRSDAAAVLHGRIY